MIRKFNDKERWKAFRKLDLSLKQLYDYCWDMADAIGVYEVDWDYLRIDTGFEYKPAHFKELMRLLPDWKPLVEIAPGKFLFVDYIEVCYERLKENYNPHKPAFRALNKHKLKINSSLNQALFKLVNEKENEYENNNENEKENIVANEENSSAPEVETAELYPTFQDFWDEYDKKVGDKGKIQKKWQKLRQDEKEKVMEYLPNYKASTPDKAYRKNPETFLNNKSWNDELIFSNGRQTGQQNHKTGTGNAGDDYDAIFNTLYPLGSSSG